jgi:putative membrane protein insertion efficiency factor
MKKIILGLITLYQATIAVVLLNLGLKSKCRFPITCSAYAKSSIAAQGIFKGGYLSIVRILKCQPFYNGN